MIVLLINLLLWKVSIEKINTRNFIKNYNYLPKLTETSPGRIVDDYAYGLAPIKEKNIRMEKNCMQ